MCEAQFPNSESLAKHIDMIHGTERWYSGAVELNLSLAPYIASHTEKRAGIEQFAKAYQFANTKLGNGPYREETSPSEKQMRLWARAALSIVQKSERKNDLDLTDAQQRC